MRERQDGTAAGSTQFGLARFSGSVLTEPAAYGGGAERATVERRRDTVAYGYLSVVEEYALPGSDARWRVLTVTLSGRVPGLIVDHRSALGRPGVAALGSAGVLTGDAAFDALYLVSAGDAGLAARILTPAVRQLLVGLPVQRFALDARALTLRTFDAVSFAGDVDERLAWLAGSVLASAPSFVSTAPWLGPGSVVALPAGDAPLLPGRYGKDEGAAQVDPERPNRLIPLLFVLAGLAVAVAAILVLVLT